MNYIVSVIIGYLLGSIPAAYLILKRTRNVDILKAGSNNVGALNSYEVSKSKIIGIVVLLVDFSKGAASTLIVSLVFAPSFELQMSALVAAVFAHCYSPWLKFKGGRGLATAAGGASVVVPIILFLWIVTWLISFAFRRNIHFSNFVATILTAGLSITSVEVLNKSEWLTNPPAETNLIFTLFMCVMMLIIISRHIGPIKEYIKAQKKIVRGAENE